MTQSYPTLKDIEADLTRELSSDFNPASPVGEEKLRYRRIQDTDGIQIGIEEEYKDEEEPDFNHIYLIIEFDHPDGMDKYYQRDFIPTTDTMDHVLRQKTGIYYHGPCDTMLAEKDIGRKIYLAYHIGFEKEKVTPKLMTSVLSRLINYFADYVEVQLDALSANFES